jgi:hypothetical protein
VNIRSAVYHLKDEVYNRLFVSDSRGRWRSMLALMHHSIICETVKEYGETQEKINERKACIIND